MLRSTSDIRAAQPGMFDQTGVNMYFLGYRTLVRDQLLG